MATAAAAELQLFLSIKFSLVRSVGGSLAAFPPCRLPAMMSYLPTPTSFYRATIPLPPPFGVVRPAARESRSFLELALLLNEIPAAFHPTLLPERERKRACYFVHGYMYMYTSYFSRSECVRCSSVGTEPLRITEGRPTELLFMASLRAVYRSRRPRSYSIVAYSRKTVVAAESGQPQPRFGRKTLFCRCSVGRSVACRNEIEAEKKSSVGKEKYTMIFFDRAESRRLFNAPTYHLVQFL